MRIHRYSMFVIACMAVASLCDNYLDGKNMASVIDRSKTIVQNSTDVIISPFQKEDKSFTQIPDGSGISNSTIYILAPETCTSLEKQRAVNMAAALAGESIPYMEKDSITLNFPPKTDANLIEKIKKELGISPVIIVNGWIKGDPTPEDVIKKYNQTK